MWCGAAGNRRRDGGTGWCRRASETLGYPIGPRIAARETEGGATGLRLKFNLAILAAFAIGFAAAWVALERQFVASARDEVLQNARIMMAAANAVRTYASQRVGPALAAVPREHFEPMTVPSYAAQTSFKALTERYPDFTCKEAAPRRRSPRRGGTGWRSTTSPSPTTGC